MTQLKPIQFHTKHRCTFQEVDAFGHMNTAHYLNFFLRHRFQGMKDTLGMDLKEIAKLPVIFAVGNVNIDFLRSVYGDEDFEIKSWVSEVQKNHCTVTAEMHKADGRKAALCTMRLVSVSKETNRAIDWPEGLFDLFYEKA